MIVQAPDDPQHIADQENPEPRRTFRLGLRCDQPCGDGLKLPCDAVSDPNRTILGTGQRDWLYRELQKSHATWNVLAQQVMMTMAEVSYAKQSGYAIDRWPGAAHERMALMKFIADRKAPNPVVTLASFAVEAGTPGAKQA